MPARVAPLLLAAATVVALSGGSCSSDKSNGDDPTLPTTRQPTTTTTAKKQDPFAVPEVIDKSYVNRVLAELYRIDGELLRRVVAERQVPAEAHETLRAIYNDPQFELELEGLAKSLAKDPKRYRQPPGDRIAQVSKLLTVRADCIFAEVLLDFSKVVVSPPPPSTDVHVLALEPTQAGADPGKLNLTRWSVSYAEVVKAGDVPQEKACDH